MMQHSDLDAVSGRIRVVASGTEAIHVAENADPTGFVRLSDGCWVIHGHRVDFVGWSVHGIPGAIARHLNSVSDLTTGVRALRLCGVLADICIPVLGLATTDSPLIAATGTN